MIQVESAAVYEACFDSGISGLVGTCATQLIDNDGGIVQPSDTADIVESPAGSGIYCANRTAPVAVATTQYSLVWSSDGTFAPGTVGIEDVYVYPSTVPLPPFIPAVVDPGPTTGPCSDWVTDAEIADCCGVTLDSDNQEALEQAAADASAILYELSGRQFAGVCGPVSVRPCRSGCGCWGGQILESPSGPHWLPVEGYWGWDDRPFRCGCGCDERVLLSGYPVRQIDHIKIDGAIIPSDGYQIDGFRWLTRLADSDGNTQTWPLCQNLQLPDTDAGTWSVSYFYGMDPPSSAVRAAAALGCELFKACAGGDCKLPTGAVKIVRQGVTIERVAALSEMLSKGATGILALDSFMAAYNPHGLKRRPAVWSPTSYLQYPRRDPDTAS